MSATIGVLAALVSAVTQAIAHALLAGGRDKLVIRGLIGFSGMIVVAPLTFFVPLPQGELWGWLLASGLLHAVYQLTLIRAYEGEDFSVAYPLARGVVPLATAVLGVTVLGDRMPVGAIAGVAIITFGLLYIAADRRPAYAGLAAAIIAGLLTTAYTLLDAHAVRTSPVLWTFVVWFFVFDGCIMSSIVLAKRRNTLMHRVRQEIKPGLLAGFASLLTYSTALIALRLIPAGSAAAIRETSIVFGAIIAAVFLKERVKGRRAIGIALVAAGGVAVAYWR